jgi:hypothetical protein
MRNIYRFKEKFDLTFAHNKNILLVNLNVEDYYCD